MQSSTAASRRLCTAKATLLADEQTQRQKFAERFSITEDQLRTPLPTQRQFLTVGEAVNQFCNAKLEGNSSEHGHHLRMHLRHMVSILGGETSVKEIDELAVQRIKQGVRELSLDPGRRDDTKRQNAKPWKSKTVDSILAAIRQFIRWLYRNGELNSEPRNLSDLKVTVVRPEIKTFSPTEVKQLVEAAEGNDLLSLSLLLMANCGFTQSDVADLKQSEFVDDGRIVRKRSKTRKHANCPTVAYQLWPRTLTLLKKEMECHDHPELAIVDAAGRALKSVSVVKGKHRDKLSKVDRIRDEYRKVKERSTLPEGSRNSSEKHLHR